MEVIPEGVEAETTIGMMNWSLRPVMGDCERPGNGAWPWYPAREAVNRRETICWYALPPGCVPKQLVCRESKQRSTSRPSNVHPCRTP